MSEEKIKQIKQTLETWQHIVDFGYGTIEVPNETKIFKTILNLIDKQQKEIDQLANGIRVLGTNPDITTEEIIKEFTEKPITEEYMKKFNSSYISKDKIREKIKEYREKRIKLADGHFFDNPDNTTNDFALFIGQEVLKELLEEEQ